MKGLSGEIKKIKYHKKMSSVTNCSSEDVSDGDRISELPDDILVDILSYLPTKDIVATSALSSRWKPFCKSFSIISIFDVTTACSQLLEVKT